jgi:hypothetical protein
MGEIRRLRRRTLPKEDIIPLFERLETLERAADIRAVTRLLVKRPPPGAVTAAAKPSAAQGKGNTLPETSWGSLTRGASASRGAPTGSCASIRSVSLDRSTGVIFSPSPAPRGARNPSDAPRGWDRRRARPRPYPRGHICRRVAPPGGRRFVGLTNDRTRSVIRTYS